MLPKGIITFDAGSKKDVLLLFNKGLDSEGYIVERETPEQRVITPNGDEITFNEFAGIRKGSEIFFKKDLPSLIELLDVIS